ncbi:potassium/proton antiporter [Pseudoalteromonas prydzensis]|uniref:potassium/proton antiporter n=1 Tax=Pseudoalteromonas prydzensis TaxID=182141 RepID=UPI00370438C8
MFFIDELILLAAVLILLGILSSKLSARLGLPVLVLFLLIGMLAGEDGIGITFDNAEAAHTLGTLALAMILFDGGLQTSVKSIKQVWKPAAMLATVGVLVTATITGFAAVYILKLSVYEGLLLGAIVGSTDAAAVFALLRNAGIHLNKRLAATLEIESASNDPMAIFLTIGLLEIIVNDLQIGVGLLQLLVMQMGLGSLVGLTVGWSAVKLINKVHLGASGLYPVMVVACGLLAFGIAANIGGSGFLAIFITGVIIGNSQFVFKKSTLLFHDGLAWLSQITMFVMLGLLVTPSSLLGVWFEGLLIASILVFVARPLAVIPILAIFGFKGREIALVSWVGLRGSVPIILAIFPLLFGLPNAALIFDVVFFVVLLSAIVQGSTLARVARKLGLIEEEVGEPAATLEITALGDVDAEIVQYTVGENSKVVGRCLSDIALPDNSVVAMITRGTKVIAPRGSTSIDTHDHVFIVLRPELRVFVDWIFSPATGIILSETFSKPLYLKGYTKVGDILDSYGLDLAHDRHLTLDEVIRNKVNNDLKIGSEVALNDIFLEVQGMVGKRISTVCLTLA